jgi:hypothetical protein
LVLALLSKISDGDADKTHMYDSFAYDVIFAIKSIGLCTFLGGIIRSSIKFNKNYKFTLYIIRLGIFGSLCFLGVPIFIFTSKWLPKHTKSTTILVGVEVIKTIEILIIGYQIVNKKSIYNQITLHGRSFMQHDNKYL